MAQQTQPVEIPPEIADLLIDRIMEVDDPSSYLGARNVVKRLPGGQYFDGHHEEYLAQVRETPPMYEYMEELMDEHFEREAWGEKDEQDQLKVVQELIIKAQEQSLPATDPWVDIDELIIHVNTKISQRSAFTFEAVWEPSASSTRKRRVIWTIHSLSSLLARPIRYYMPRKTSIQFRGPCPSHNISPMSALLILRAKLFDLCKMLGWMVYDDENQQLEIHFLDGMKVPEGSQSFWETKPYPTSTAQPTLNWWGFYYECLLLPLLSMGPWCEARVVFETPLREQSSTWNKWLADNAGAGQVINWEEENANHGYQKLQRQIGDQKKDDNDWYYGPGSRDFDDGLGENWWIELHGGWLGGTGSECVARALKTFEERVFMYLVDSPPCEVSELLSFISTSESFRDATVKLRVKDCWKYTPWAPSQHDENDPRFVFYDGPVWQYAAWRLQTLSGKGLTPGTYLLQDEDE